MPFFNATTEKGKAKVSAMQDFVDGLEANGIPVPEHVRSELDYYNNILVRHIADQNLSDSGEKLENYDVPDAYAEETKKRKKAFQDWEDQDAVNEAAGIMRGEKAKPEGRLLRNSIPDHDFFYEASARKRNRTSSKYDVPELKWDKK